MSARPLRGSMDGARTSRPHVICWRVFAPDLASRPLDREPGSRAKVGSEAEVASALTSSFTPGERSSRASLVRELETVPKYTSCDAEGMKPEEITIELGARSIEAL